MVGGGLVEKVGCLDAVEHEAEVSLAWRFGRRALQVIVSKPILTTRLSGALVGRDGIGPEGVRAMRRNGDASILATRAMLSLVLCT